jgi:hypothetical protein
VQVLGLRVPLLLGLTALQCIRCIATNLHSDLIGYRKVYPLFYNTSHHHHRQCRYLRASRGGGGRVGVGPAHIPAVLGLNSLGSPELPGVENLCSLGCELDLSYGIRL